MEKYLNCYDITLTLHIPHNLKPKCIALHPSLPLLAWITSSNIFHLYNYQSHTFLKSFTTSYLEKSVLLG